MDSHTLSRSGGMLLQKSLGFYSLALKCILRHLSSRKRMDEKLGGGGGGGGGTCQIL